MNPLNISLNGPRRILMEFSSKSTLINKKLTLLFTFASFLSFLFLSVFINQKLQLCSNLSAPISSTDDNKFSNCTIVEGTLPLSSPKLDEEKAKCDLFKGKWVYDAKAHPLYQWHQCPFLDAQVNCQKNGRPDSGYEHWKWEAEECEIPRFNGSYMLERMRGKRLVMIGDSLNRNQWESMACLLYPSIRLGKATVKTNGNDMIFQAMDYNFSLEFFWSPFLVTLDEMKNGSKVLKIEELPASAWQWQDADVIVFGTGHWWTHTGRIRTWDYFEWKGKLLDMDTNDAFDIAFKTWAQWIDQKVDATKTTIFFRSISPEHKRESMQWCYNQTHPTPNGTYMQRFPKSMISTVERTIKNMKTPVTYLNITRLSEDRPDAHTSVYTTRQWKLLTKEQRENPRMYSDCSHWCLPGLPDTWNKLLYASLLGTLPVLS